MEKLSHTNTGLEYYSYKFAAKNLDEETGLYYYGARYLDPRYPMWISTDPALGEYIPGIGKENAENSRSLPGMGGVFNSVNGNLYHYAGNNPVKYTDPDGRDIVYLMDPNRGRNRETGIRSFPFGHAACLVGNDDGWLYFSNDGSASTDIQWFNSKKEFFENYSSKNPNDVKEENMRKNPFKFKEVQTIKTTSEQDKKMQQKVFDLGGIDSKEGFEGKDNGKRWLIRTADKPTPYHFLKNNCSQNVAEIAGAGDVYSINSLIPKTMVLMDKKTYELYLKYQFMQLQNIR